jgi:hypothetical protein
VGEIRSPFIEEEKMKKLSILSTAMVPLFLLPIPAPADDDTLIAVLNSGQEIQDPKPDSNAIGNALLTFQDPTGMLCYSISFTELVGEEAVAHFHAPASAGENADILFDISPMPPGPSDLGSPKTGCVGPLSEEEAIDLREGLFYINVHSDVFPAGEIRGQVLRIERATTNAPVAE